MEQNIEIICQQCKNVISKPQSAFQSYYGKIVAVRCSKCNGQTRVKVDAAFINMKSQSSSSKIKERQSFEETLVLKSKDTEISEIKSACLIISKSEFNIEQILELTEGENIIGRFNPDHEFDNKRSVHSQDKTMSKRHCKITQVTQNGKISFFIKDLNSLNFTYVNDDKLGTDDEIGLLTDDIIKIGQTIMKFKIN
jgi:hypothetical protein